MFDHFQPNWSRGSRKKDVCIFSVVKQIHSIAATQRSHTGKKDTFDSWKPGTTMPFSRPVDFSSCGWIRRPCAKQIGQGGIKSHEKAQKPWFITANTISMALRCGGSGDVFRFGRSPKNKTCCNIIRESSWIRGLFTLVALDFKTNERRWVSMELWDAMTAQPTLSF